MKTYIKNKMICLVAFCFFSIPALTIRAGALVSLSELVKPGGVEIPAIVNVIGPEEPDDVNNVKEIFRTVNSILNKADIQFNVKWIKTGITEIGDGDRKLSENEFNEILLHSVFELGGLPRVESDPNTTDAVSNRENGRPGIGKGITFNIADDVWVEQPDRVFWYDRFYPVVCLESSIPPQQSGYIVVQEFGFAAELSPSTDPANFMYPDGQGTEITEDQKSSILELARQIGYVRSPLAEGYSQEILADLRHKWPGALFESEGFALRGDYREDVKIENIDGSQIGSSGVDLEAFIAKIKRGESDIERALVLKYYLANIDLPENIYFDTYLRITSYPHDKNGNEDTIGLPWDTFDAVIGTGLTSSGSYVGVTNLLDNDDFHQLIGIQPEVSVDLGRTKVKITAPFSRLEPYLPADILEYLNDGRGVELHVTSNSVFFDPLSGIRFEDDSIENLRLAAKPKLIPQITAQYSFDNIDTSTLSLGWQVSTRIIDEDPNSLDHNTILELFNQPFSGAVAGQGVYSWLNFNTNFNNDSFNSANGFTNDPYPGIDLSGIANLNFLTEAKALIELPAGLHIFSLQGNDTAIMQISPVKIGSLFHYKQYSQNGIDRESTGDSINNPPSYKKGWEDNHISVLQHGDSPFEVKDPGLYLLNVRSLSQFRAEPVEDVNDTSGASLELQQVLPDGTRVLIGDVINGANTVLVLPVDF
jgi:hypothetical protein